MFNWLRARWRKLIGAPVAPAAWPVSRRFEDAASAALTARRRALALAGVDAERLPPPGAVGLAISGGGVRSATIALGASQALSAHDRLLDFDYISTVSGGGYFGSFLRSLFIPPGQRGLMLDRRPAPRREDLAGQLDFAAAVLKAGANQKEVDAPTGAASPPGQPAARIRNPVWWLREHGRYLAPNGSSDYAAALAYMSRNWFAMIFVISLAMAMLLLARTGLFWMLLQFDPAIAGWNLLDLLRGVVPPSSCRPVVLPAGEFTFQSSSPVFTFGEASEWGRGRRLGPALFDPVLLIVPAFAVLGMSAGIAYWLTQWLPVVPGFALLRRPRLVQYLGLAGAALAVAGLARLVLRPFCDYPTVVAGIASWALILLLSLALLINLIISLSVYRRGAKGFVPELRSRLTRSLARFNTLTMAALALGVVGTIALALRPWVASLGEESPTVLATSVLLPAGAWLISQLPKWFSGGGRVSSWLRGHVRLAALVAGLLLFGVLAVLVDVLVQSVLWPDGAWQRASAAPALGWGDFAVCTGMVAGLAILTGSSTSFINLSSLHNLYSARLTRAYLGASNVDRLGEPRHAYKPITESHPRDDLPISVYSQLRSCAPLHLVNVTLNETRSREASQLVERDRKGVPVVFGPEGVLLDPACGSARGDHWYPWSSLDEQGVESLSVGQLCAISGAAASTGMGAKTSLGTALALTFANVRLGYWWRVGNLVRRDDGASSGKAGLGLAASRPLRSYRYLWNEMTSQYSRDFERLYLSDGGHFENSGAYELLRRRVPAILVLDNGADPRFEFEDLENLIRKARIDMGLSVNVMSREAVEALFGRQALPLFFNAEDDWRGSAAKPGGHGVALALCVYAPAEQPGASPRIVSRLLWVKPRLSQSLPHDVRSYGRANPAFPQEPTADQFFGEAQWESYRAVGFASVDALFARTFHGPDLLRRMADLGA